MFETSIVTVAGFQVSLRKSSPSPNKPSGVIVERMGPMPAALNSGDARMLAAVLREMADQHDAARDAHRQWIAETPLHERAAIAEAVAAGRARG